MNNTNSTLLDRRSLLALVEASRAINGELRWTAVLDLIVDHAAVVLKTESATVFLLDDTRDELVFQATVGPEGELVRSERMPASRGIAGQAVRTRRAVRVDDVTKNANFYSEIDDKTHLQTRSLLAAPLIHEDRVQGVVEVINPLDRTHFDDSDLELLKLFANLAAAATHKARALDQVSRENVGLRTATSLPRMIGRSEAMKRVQTLFQKVAATNTTVLLQGETGTGKELAARAIHAQSPRCDKPFIAINCAALPETLLESELFGHEQGAFTGANSRKLGRFELANEGTLFLDEIAELSESSQTKLLRVLQEREFTRVGGTQTIHCDSRILVATNRDLKTQVDAGQFREDVYYRLSVFPIELAPLRKRIEDVPLLVEHFLKLIVPELGIDPPNVSDEAMACMMRYQWPGNIRELHNVMERCALLADRVITVADLPTEFCKADGDQKGGTLTSAGSKLADQERAMIVEALERALWNQSATARDLGVSRDFLRYRMKKYQIERPHRRSDP